MTVFSELRMRPATATHRGWNASTTTRLVLAGVVMFTLLLGANLATPLYPLLQVQLGLGPLGVTVAFASYVLALVAVLVLAGHWSDHIGRRAALVLAVALGLAGSLVFAGAGSLWMLCAGRALQGIAVGLATGASSAALRELLPLKPEWASRFTLLASSGGVAAGPFIGGLLSLLPGPLSTPFLVHCALLLLLLVPLWLLDARPAIRPADGPRPYAALAPKRPAVSRESRSIFALAAAVGFLSFAVFGFCLSLGPGYFSAVAGTGSRPVMGLLAGLTLGASAVSQLLALRGRLLLPAGLAVLGAAVVLMAAAAAWHNPVLLVAASIAAGLGQGTAFRLVFNELASRAAPSEHAQVISAVYVITYLGSAVPVIGLGLASSVVGLENAVTGFAVICGVAALGLAVVSLVSLHGVRRASGR